VLHAINHCVTTQLFLFDRPSTAVGAGPARDEEDDEEEDDDNGGGSGAQKKKKKKNSSSSTVADGRHNTLIAGKKIFHTEQYKCMLLNDTEGNQHATNIRPKCCLHIPRDIFLIPGVYFRFFTPLNWWQPTTNTTQRVLIFLDFSRFSAGLSGFVATTGHSEVLKPVVGVIGEWVATVAYGWINAGENLMELLATHAFAVFNAHQVLIVLF
jgi:hypothetical protein